MADVGEFKDILVINIFILKILKLLINVKGTLFSHFRNAYCSVKIKIFFVVKTVGRF